MPRFFVSSQAIDKENRTVEISGEDARHIARSLRMAVGDAVVVCDGDGTEYETTLTKIRDDLCLGEFSEFHKSKNESPVFISLYMAYPKSDKLETVIQKAVECGASRIIPFESSRCIKRPSQDKADARRERLLRISAEAAKQCGRAILPDVSHPMSFRDMIKSAGEADLVLFCYEGKGAVSLKTVLECAPVVRSISVIVGSEGGFSPEEATFAKEAGFKTVNLGPRILRCETAPDYVLAAISYFFEL